MNIQVISLHSSQAKPAQKRLRVGLLRSVVFLFFIFFFFVKGGGPWEFVEYDVCLSHSEPEATRSAQMGQEHIHRAGNTQTPLDPFRICPEGNPNARGEPIPKLALEGSKAKGLQEKEEPQDTLENWMSSLGVCEFVWG